MDLGGYIEYNDQDTTKCDVHRAGFWMICSMLFGGIMKLFIRCCCLITLLTLSAAHLAFAETVLPTSLEWQTCSAEVIVVGSIKAVITPKDSHAAPYKNWVVSVKRILKGALNSNMTDLDPDTSKAVQDLLITVVITPPYDLALLGRKMAQERLGVDEERFGANAQSMAIKAQGTDEIRGTGYFGARHVSGLRAVVEWVVFTPPQADRSSTTGSFLISNANLLLFLSKSKNHEQYPNGKWVPSSRSSSIRWVINLSKPLENIFSKDMKTVDDKEELLMIVSRWAKSKVKHSHRLDLPHNSPLFDSSVFNPLRDDAPDQLIVPAEEKLRLHFIALARSKQSYHRTQAARELWKYPGQETEKVLFELLKDDNESYVYDALDRIAHVEYDVRSKAYGSLRSLGKSVLKPVLQRKPTLEEQRTLRVKIWKQSFAKALEVGWTISVDDGASRKLEGQVRTIVVVIARNQKRQVKWVLVPKEWSADDLPKAKYLGIGLDRHFYFEGNLPDNVKQQIISYFDLDVIEHPRQSIFDQLKLIFNGGQMGEETSSSKER